MQEKLNFFVVASSCHRDMSMCAHGPPSPINPANQILLLGPGYVEMGRHPWGERLSHAKKKQTIRNLLHNCCNFDVAWHDAVMMSEVRTSSYQNVI